MTYPELRVKHKEGLMNLTEGNEGSSGIVFQDPQREAGCCEILAWFR
jgi:hypothetical protein